MAFVSAAIAAVGSAFGSGSLLAGIAKGLLTSVAVSALSAALAPTPRAAGLRTEQTLTGDLAPASFILGRFATAGSAVCPAMSHGQAGRTPNAWLTYVIALADRPGHRLEALWIDGEEAPITATVETEHGYGNELGGEFAGRGWVKFYDGTQTAADPMLLAKYGADPDRPWQVDMVGTGLCYAIVTFRYDREVYNGFPALRFVLSGAPLYDPRQDSTAGGAGPQRWSDPATWAQTDNPVVMIYNILRGITLAPGRVWGPGLAAGDLRAADWFGAMNVCDQEVAIAGGGTRPRYRAGWEVRATDEPASVIEELLKTCSGDMADMGGTWRIRAGGPGLPSYYITDEDILVSRPEQFTPFPPIEQIFNAISVTYPGPAALYEKKESPMRRNAAWEAEDGGRFLPTTLDLPACPYFRQAQRVGLELIRDHRRMRAHGFHLGHPAAKLELLDVIGWTSARNGYEAKAFDLREKQEDAFSATSALTGREKNAADYDWQVTDELPDPVPSAVIRRPVAQTVPGFAVAGVDYDDGTGKPRKPAIRLSWDGEAIEDAVAIEWEMRRVGKTTPGWQGSMRNVAAGERILSGGIIANVAYEARVRPAFANRKRAWTAWQQATAPAVYLQPEDFGAGETAFEAFMRARGITPVLQVTSLPTTAPANADDLVNYQGEIHRWDGGAGVWTKAVDVGDLTGQITDTALFAQGIRPPEVVASLPESGNYPGRLVVLLPEGKLHRHLGTPADATGFTVEVDGADIKANSITAGAIAAGAIGATEIAAGAIVASKIAVGDFTNLVPDNVITDPGSWTIATHTGDGGAGVTVYTDATSLGTKPKASLGLIGIWGHATYDRICSSARFPVEAGRDYWLSGQIWRRTGSGTPTAARWRLLWFDHDGAWISTANATASSFGAGSTVGLAVTAPANAVTAQLQAYLSGGAGSEFVFTSPGLRRKAGGELIVDGTISASHLDTGSLGVAGVAIFGGVLASSNYATGSAGWRVTQAGDAEFNSLIVRRGMLDIGAAAIEASAYAGGTITKTENAMAYGEDLLITVTDAGLSGKRVWITYAAEVELTRSTIGYVEARFTLAGDVSFDTYRARVYIPVANGVLRLPFVATRRLVAPTGTTWQISSQPHMENLPSGVTGSVKFAKRSLILRANMDQ